MSTNIYWMYENKMENVDRLRPAHAVLSGGTADTYDFDLNTQYKGTCARGTHSLYVYFNGTGIHCDTVVLVSNPSMVGTFAVWWGTRLLGGWSGANCAIHPSGTTLLTWIGTVVYVKCFAFRWHLDVRNDATANELFLGKRLELSSNPLYPFHKEEINDVTVGETTKGVRHSYHNFDRRSWYFQYEGISDSDKESVESMVDYCEGSYKPLWFTLDPNTPEETEFVRFSTDIFNFEEIVSGYWRVDLPLEQEL